MMPSDLLPIAIGERLVGVVNLISHREGKVLVLMNEYSVTLPQILILNKLENEGDLTLSKIADAFKMSLSSVSQMIDRLLLKGFVERHEIQTTPSENRSCNAKIRDFYQKTAQSAFRRICNGDSPILLYSPFGP